MNIQLLSQPGPADLPAYLSNGLIGLRVGAIPPLRHSAAVAGYVDVAPQSRAEAAARPPYPLALDLALEHRWLSLQPERAQFIGQSYDWSCGELVSRFRMVGEAAVATVEMTQFCSRTHPTVVAQELVVTLDAPGKLRVTLGLDAGAAPGRPLLREGPSPANRGHYDGAVLWESANGRSQLGAAFICVADAAWQRHEAHMSAHATPAAQFAVDAEAGRSYRVWQISSLVPGNLHSQPDRQAMRLAHAAAIQLGFAQLRAANRAAWAELWRGRVLLHGAGARWQRNADAACFYLHTSVHPASLNGVGLFGTNLWPNYHNFNGHTFWDIDTFVVPPLILTAPDAARALLAFRARGVPAARVHAALNGYQGLQFPWEAGQHGEEVLPPDHAHLLSEQHISLDVAHAFAQYARATGAPIFLREQAWPILRGVAEWIASRVRQTARGYEILGVTGIDEGRVWVDNSVWINAGAITVLREAAACAEKIGYRAPPRWRAIADRLALPRDEASGGLLNYDGFTVAGEHASCPDAMLAYFPGLLQTDAATEQATYQQRLAWSRPAVGYPMHSPLQGVFAARLGERELALDLFERGFGDFVFGPFALVDEYSSRFTETKEKVGPYLAHCGGFLLSCLYGLPGLALRADDPATWPARPVILPAGWEAIEVERIWVQGEPMHLRAEQGGRCQLTPQSTSA